jgi:hypothetical protein
MPTYSSTHFTDTIPFEDGCTLIAAHQRSAGRRRGVYFTTTLAPEDTQDGLTVFQEVTLTWTLRSELLKGSLQKNATSFSRPT